MDPQPNPDVVAVPYTTYVVVVLGAVVGVLLLALAFYAAKDRLLGSTSRARPSLRRGRKARPL